MAETLPAGPVSQAWMETPFGWMAFEARDERLTGIDLHPADVARPEAERRPQHALLAEVIRQFERYFTQPACVFDLPLAELGTAYQQRLWRALRAIPVGEVRSYAALAAQEQSGPRAVASACRANPFPIIVPCHRVVARHDLGGYCGARTGPMLDIKRWLLRHEGYRADVPDAG
ncbi:methylated-DNA--[protein]-cysteine S-methyltransferase [Methyloparacoccus murrellii]